MPAADMGLDMDFGDDGRDPWDEPARPPVSSPGALSRWAHLVARPRCQAEEPEVVVDDVVQSAMSRTYEDLCREHVVRRAARAGSSSVTCRARVRRRSRS